MQTLIADIETDGLLDTLTRVWCIGIGSADEDDVVVYADQPGYLPLSEGLGRIREAGRVVFHNGVGFDFQAIERLYPGTLRLAQVIDTLILSRMADPEKKEHNLKALGAALGFEKIEFNDWTKFSEEMATYQAQDVRVGRAIYRDLLKKTAKFSPQSIRSEHAVALAISLQEQNGFCLDVPAAEALEQELRVEQLAIEAEMDKVFPPRWVAVTPKNSVVYPWVESAARAVKVAKSNARGYVKDAPFTKVDLLPFNSASRKQIEARLRLHGWEPRKFTASGAAQLDDEVLQDLAATMPVALPLARHARLGKQLGQISDGDNGWLKLVKKHPDGSSRIHGRVNPIGCVTHRMSHFAPNMGQVDKKDSRMRAVWVARPGWKLVGCDADAIEARALAHYLEPYDGGEFRRSVVEGTKEAGTDIHTRNMRAVRMWKRDKGMSVKNLFYAYLLYKEAA